MFFNKNSTTGILIYRPPKLPIFQEAAIFSESFEYPNWYGTYDTGSIPSASFTGSVLFSETFEYPDWYGTYDSGSLPSASFTGSVLFGETFDSGSWP